MSRKRVIVVGGGWAGIAAAVELSLRGYQPLLLESARQLGGRARAVRHGELALDNGQHLLIGAYTETLRLMQVVGAEPEKSLLRVPLKLDMLGERPLSLSAPHLPAPLNLAAALMLARGLSIAERLRALRFALAMFVSGFTLHDDRDLTSLLRQHGQTPSLVERLWEPLCLATLNTPADQASAQVFLRVLQDAFARQRAHSDLLFARQDLGRLFPEPALTFLRKRGGEVRLGCRVEALVTEEDRLRGVMVDGALIEADDAVLAVPAWTAQRLLAPHPAAATAREQLRQLSHEPITTVYLRYPPTVRLESPMLGMVGGLCQWLFDRGIYGQAGVMAVVLSGRGAHHGMAREELSDRVARELATHFPAWPEPLEHWVIREQRATFHCGVALSRPGYHSGIQGLWLAGDYVANGYPATLEGAVRSGVQCAAAIAATSANKEGFQESMETAPAALR